MQTSTTPHNKNAKHLLADIDQGLIGLPRFQRDFVWSLEKSAALVDSILKGFPIGALIFWRTTEKLKDHRQLGNLTLPEPPAGQDRNYVLDGQQRLKSLYASLRGSTVTLANGRERDFKNIWVDLSKCAVDDDFCVTDLTDRDETRCIPLHELFENSSLKLARRFPEDTHDRIETYRDAIAAYQISYVQLQNAPIPVASEVFTRVNIGGEKLTLFEIMVAKTFDADQGFDLLTEWEALAADLENVKYDTVGAITALHIVAMIAGQDVRRQKILDMKREDFIEVWPQAVKALKRAVDFCRQTAGMRVSRLMPYTSCLAPIAYFLHIRGSKVSAKDSKALLRYLFSAGWAERYTGPLDTNLNQDRLSMDGLFKTGVLTLEFSAEISSERIAEQEFRANEAFSKTILAVMARKDPKDFATNASVDLDNSAMQRANSRNFHHFFPRAFLRKRGISAAELTGNSIANITLVGDQLNKHVIRARKPSDYLAEFKAENQSFARCLKSHHINSGDNSPVWDDDYEGFVKMRAKA
ncbi:MAG: DUF262 domain-containing protein [Pseudomonadota bacterium]